MTDIAAEEAAALHNARIDTLSMVDHRVPSPSVLCGIKVPPRGQITTWPAVREYLFAGNCVFTLVSVKKGARFTYKVRARKEDVVKYAELMKLAAQGGEFPEEGFICYFVNLLRGPNNEKDFAYLGVLRKPDRFFTTSKSQVSRHAVAHKALVWFLNEMRGERDVLGKVVQFWHNGHCGKCGRLLTVPSSVLLGLGPVCDGR